MFGNKSPQLYLLIFLILFLLMSCSSSQNTVTVKTATDEVEIVVEIADSIDEQAFGLMHRTELAHDHGMLFVFEDEKQRIFWMKNTEIPLDILFIDQNRTIVDVKENFEQCISEDCEKYYSLPAMYVLEVNAGFVEEYKIVLGNIVMFK